MTGRDEEVPVTGGDDNPAERTYEVGYGRPPKQHRFRKGQSGNPRGRPRGATGVGGVLEKALAQEITVTEGGRTLRISKREALILSLVTRALKGDMRAAAQTLRLIEAHEAKAQAMGPQPAGGGLVIHVVDQFDDPQ